MKLNLSCQRATNVFAEDFEAWQRLIERLEAIEMNFSPMRATLILVDDAHIRQLNHRFRDNDRSTDVLTFKYDEGDIDAEIYISIETAADQATRHNLTLPEELAMLSVHGLLHALGYDHERSTKDHDTMRELERQILDDLQLHHVSPLTT